MRKFLFILLLIPLFASIGHDAYFYYENQDKGFRISDIGALWDRYHKESHDQWKSKVQDFSTRVDELVADSPMAKDTAKAPTPYGNEHASQIDALSEGFTQSSTRDGVTTSAPFEPEDEVVDNSKGLIKWIGFLLEQKAIYVSALIPVIGFLLNAIISFVFREKSNKSKIRGIQKKRNKDGGYQYKRK